MIGSPLKALRQASAHSMCMEICFSLYVLSELKRPGQATWPMTWPMCNKLRDGRSWRGRELISQRGGEGVWRLPPCDPLVPFTML